jgi:hypothetical protein
MPKCEIFGALHFHQAADGAIKFKASIALGIIPACAGMTRGKLKPDCISWIVRLA